VSAGKGPWPDPLRLDGADYNAHHFAGYLSSLIERGPITVEGWNEALLAAREQADHDRRRTAEHAEQAKRNAMAARRRTGKAG
jgi:hypothetical protein